MAKEGVISYRGRPVKRIYTKDGIVLSPVFMLYETESEVMPFLTERWWALSYSPGL